MSVPSSWAIRNEKLGGHKVDKCGKGDPGASQSGGTSQICGSIGAGVGASRSERSHGYQWTVISHSIEQIPCDGIH